jgi:hypothetical protein
MGLVGLLCDYPSWSNTVDQSVMNFVEVTSLLLPAILLVVLFIRMKILAGKQVILQSYVSKDVLMQEQARIYVPDGKLPFSNTSQSLKMLGIWLLLFLTILLIYFSNQ